MRAAAMMSARCSRSASVAGVLTATTRRIFDPSAPGAPCLCRKSRTSFSTASVSAFAATASLSHSSSCALAASASALAVSALAVSLLEFRPVPGDVRLGAISGSHDVPRSLKVELLGELRALLREPRAFLRAPSKRRELVLLVLADVRHADGLGEVGVHLVLDGVDLRLHLGDGGCRRRARALGGLEFGNGGVQFALDVAAILIQFLDLLHAHLDVHPGVLEVALEPGDARRRLSLVVDASAATGRSRPRLSSAACLSARSCSTSAASNRAALAWRDPLLPPVISPLFLIMVPSKDTTLNRRSPPKVMRFASAWVSHTTVSLPMA